jgi:hypothetical protein
MGYQVGRTCFLNAADAVDGWKAQFPTAPDSNGAMWYVNASAFTSTASAVTITGTLKKSTSTTTTTITGVVLPNCTADKATYILDKYPIQDIFFAGAMAIALILGFISGRTR